MREQGTVERRGAYLFVSGTAAHARAGGGGSTREQGWLGAREQGRLGAREQGCELVTVCSGFLFSPFYPHYFLSRSIFSHTPFFPAQFFPPFSLRTASMASKSW
jgi:hypothetical protein